MADDGIEYLIRIILDAKDTASAKVAALKAELDKLKGSTETSRATQALGKDIDDLGDSAKRTKAEHKQLREEQERSSKGTRDLGEEHRKTAGSQRDLAIEIEKARAKDRESIPGKTGLSKAVAELNQQYDNYLNTLRDTRQTEQEQLKTIDHFKTSYQSLARQLGPVGDEFQKVSARVDDLNRRSADIRFGPNAGKDAISFKQKVAEATSEYDSFDRKVKTGVLSTGEVKRGYQDFSRTLNLISRGFADGSKEAEKYGVMADEAAKKAKNAAIGSTGGFFGSIKRGDTGGAIEYLDAKFTDLGFRITGVSSFLRGFFALAKIAFAQPLITGLLSIAGGLIAVGSAAAQAGAALSGAFISGLAQAIPVVSIAAAALLRLKSVFQAVSISSEAEKQSALEPNAGEIKKLQNQSQLISAQQQLANSSVQLFDANQRVKDSQIALTESRVDAIRNIQDLELAEKGAKLAAEGASLSLEEARRQLQISIQQGDVAGISSAELQIKNAELAKSKSEIEVPRSERDARIARQRGVSGNRTVISAVEGVSSSKQAVVQAQQAAESARREMKIVEDQLAQPASRTSSQQAQLNYLLKQMSAPERALYIVLHNIDKELKSPSSPLRKITDYIVEPFTEAAEKLQFLLHDNKFIGVIDSLAKQMGNSFKRLGNFTFGSEGTSFFEEMAKDAKSNLPIVTDSIIKILKLFENIAKAAAPAFHKLSEDWDKFWSGIDKKYETPEGFNKLEQFFNKSVHYAESFAHLGKALGQLFLSIGHDAAPEGLKTVNNFTGSIESATNWVKTHGPEVTKFFREAREGLELIGGILFTLGKELLEVFSLTSLKAFSGFLNQLIIPALRDIVELMGFFITFLLKIIDKLGPLRGVFEGITAVVLALIGFAKAYSGILKVIEALKVLRGVAVVTAAAFEAFKLTGFTSLSAAIDAAILKLKELRGAAVVTAETIETTSAAEAASVEGAVAAESTSAGAAGGGVLAGARGLLGKAALPLAGIGAYVLARPGGQETGTSGLPTGSTSYFGGQFDRYAGKELGNLEHLQIGKFVSGIFGTSNDESKSELRLRGFGNEVEKLKGKISTLPNRKLEEISNEAKKLSQNPSLSKFRGALEEVSKTFKPSEIAAKQWAENVEKFMEKLSPAARNVAETFQNISITSGSIWKNLKENLKTSIEDIKENLGINSKQGKEAVSASFDEIVIKIEESMKKGGMSTQKGMARIRQLVNEELKMFGIKPSEIVNAAKGAASTAGRVGRGLSSGFASGGFVGSPGQRGPDDVHVALGRGEAVLNAPQQATVSRRMAMGGYLGGLHEVFRDTAGTKHFASGGFVADPGTNFSMGQEPKLVTALRQLGEFMRTTIYGISGYRSPAHSVEVGGFADDPHTRGEAADVGVGSNTLASAARLTAALLSKFGLYRPFYPASAHEINHIQLIPSDASKIIGSIAGTTAGSSPMNKQFEQIVAPIIKGGGAIGAVAQNAVNIATIAANKHLEKLIGSSAETGPTGVGAPAPKGQVTEWLTKALKLTNHYSSANLSALYGRTIQESSGNPLSINLTDSNAKAGHPSKGLLQTIPETFASYMLPGHGNIWNPVDNAIAAIRYMFARYHHIVGPSSSGYAVGGKVAPWGGRPVMIEAHEGERVMNPNQYGETARLAGMSSGGLDSHLGFNGSSPRQSFADGGKVASNNITIRNILPSFETITDIGDLIDVIKKINIALRKLKKIPSGSYQKKLNKYIEEITDSSEIGILSEIQKAKEFIKSRMQRSATKKEYKQIGSKIILGSGGQVGIDTQNINILNQEAKYLEQERNIIKSSMEKASKIKNSTKRNAALNILKLKQKEFDESIDQNIEARYQAAQQKLQDQLSALNSNYQTITQGLSTSQGAAQAFGKFGELPGIDQQIKSAAESQINAITPLLSQAESSGNTELANSIKQEIFGLRQTITNSIVEQISAGESLIQQEASSASSKSGMLSSFSKLAAGRGEFAKAGQLEQESLQTTGNSLVSQRASLEQLLAQASAAGDTGAIVELTNQLNDNSAKIAENNEAIRDNITVTRELVISNIERESQFTKGIYGGIASGIETLGKITGAVDIKALKGAVEGEGSALAGERVGLEKQASGLGVEGMSPEQLLKFFESSSGQAQLNKTLSTENEKEKEQTEKLVNALISNADATLANKQKLAELNGKLNQSQSFSTQAFQQFRTPFFNGMGGLLSQYAAALPPGSFEGMPQYATASPGKNVNIHNLNMTQPVQNLDTQLFNEQLSYHIGTAA